jgi:hypothetical protein
MAAPRAAAVAMIVNTCATVGVSKVSTGSADTTRVSCDIVNPPNVKLIDVQLLGEMNCYKKNVKGEKMKFNFHFI